jgi:cytochrome P450
MKILIAKLVKNFDFELVAGQNLKPTSKITLRPVDGAKCFISPRKF